MYAPLLQRQPHAPIAWLSEGLSSVGLPPGEVSAEVFIAQVKALAAALPDARYAINLCSNRYLFLLSLCAVVVRQQTNLLPANKRPATQQTLSEEYRPCYLLHDGVAELCELPQLDVRSVDFELEQAVFEVPNIALEHTAVISFTSGSTGKSKPNIKSWHTVLASTEINRRYMLPNQDEVFYHLATVPGQHMWGLETSVIMALFANVCIADTQPFYPHDIAAELNKLPAPRSLIATPVHLRALTSLSGAQAKLANVLCATAPLATELAQQIETLFETCLREVYGCSEVGSMAVRETANTDLWLRFEGLEFSPADNGLTKVSAAHLPDEIILEDQLVYMDAQHFKLRGRQTDQIKVAGKRASLQELNQILSRCAGLLDGVIFMPPQNRTVPRLAALVVLDDRTSKEVLRAHLKKYLDEAFLPRPIMVVERLPREENGKLGQQRLLDFYETHKSKRA